MSERFTFPVRSYRRLDTPFDRKKNSIAIVRVDDLPDLSEWRGVNVREVKKTGRVPKAIRSSLSEHPDTFVFMNRGLVLTVADMDFDNHKSMLTIELDDPKRHGLLDGGHTYEIIVEERTTLPHEQFVKIELLQGFNGDEILDIVEARNTSNQVQDKSLLNLQGAFQPLRQALAGKPYEHLIAYKENADGPIDIRELISYLYPFDVQYHDGKGQPITAYQSKALCLNHFRRRQEDDNRVFDGIFPLADDIFRLWDLIHLELPTLYNTARGGGRFGALSGVVPVRDKPEPLYFIGEESEYRIPAAMKYPILAAFRAFIEVDGNGIHRWVTSVGNPEHLLYNGLGEELALKVGKEISQTRNPVKTGKSALLWESCYQAARILLLERS